MLGRVSALQLEHEATQCDFPGLEPPGVSGDLLGISWAVLKARGGSLWLSWEFFLGVFASCCVEGFPAARREEHFFRAGGPKRTVEEMKK